MKKLILSLLFFVSISIMGFAATKTVSFNVMISNAKGKKQVEKAIGKEDGVKSCKADEKRGMAVVEYDDTKIDPAQITAAFKKHGYYASPIGENCSTKPGGCLNNKPTTTNTMR